MNLSSARCVCSCVNVIASVPTAVLMLFNTVQMSDFANERVNCNCKEDRCLPPHVAVVSGIIAFYMLLSLMYRFQLFTSKEKRH